MNLLIAPNSFKGSLDAWQVAEALAAGFQRASSRYQCHLMPIADGGDHFAEVMTRALGGQMVAVPVLDPLGRPITASYGLAPNGTAIVEMAKASGLALLSSGELDPMRATTYGTGQLLAHAIGQGARRILLGIGGSATNDGGAGALEALGFRFRDAQGQPVPRGGGFLKLIQTIDDQAVDPIIRSVEWTIACDVDNPLVGPRGASAVFGPQKGATPAQVQQLDAHLDHFGQLLERATGRPIRQLAGGGAAGGIAAGFAALLGANLQNGTDLVLRQLDFDQHLAWADWVVTAEGKLDGQTLGGKGPHGIALRAKEAGKIVVAFAGALPENVENFAAFDALFAIADRPLTLAESMQEASQLIEKAAYQVGRLGAVLTAHH